MTDYNPLFRVVIDGTVWTGLVDYQINISNGQATPFTMPQPTSMNLRLIFTDTPSFPVDLRSKVEVQFWDPAAAPAAWVDLATCWVTDYTFSYQTWGVSGQVSAIDIQAIGSLAFLNGQTYYLDAASSTTTKAAVNALFAAVNSTSWEEVNPTSTWNDIDASITWANYDKALSTIVTASATGNNGPNVTRPAGYRDVMNDLQLLWNGSHSVFYEGTDGRLVWLCDPLLSVNYTVTPGMLLADYEAGISISDIRNLVTVTELGTTLAWYGDDVSRYTYGTMDGSIDTLLDLAADATTAAQWIVKGSAIPTLTRRSMMVEMNNPNLTDLDREYFFQALPGNILNTSALTNPGDVAQFQVWGRQISISRNSVLVTLNGGSVSWFNGTPTWRQISPSYTWTSYGTAFPTQKWSDL